MDRFNNVDVFNNIEYSDFTSFNNEISQKRDLLYKPAADFLQETDCKFVMEEMKEVPNGRFSVICSGVEFECCCNKKDSEKLYIVLNGGKPSPTAKLPVFNRHSYYNLLDGTMINIADPMYRKFDKLNVGWYYGTAEENYLEYLINIINKFAQILNKKNEDIIILSSSAGGYASLYCGSRIKYSTVICFNPQISLALYPYTTEIASIIGVSFDEQDKYERNCLYSAMEKAKDTRFFLIENCRSSEDMIQLDAFCKYMNVNFSYGLSQLTNNIVTWVYDANGIRPHNAQDYKAIMNAIINFSNREFDVESNKNLYMLIGELWHERFDVFYQNEILRKKAEKAVADLSELEYQIQGEQIYFSKELIIFAKSYIHNHVMIFDKLKPNTVYDFSINNTELIAGETSKFTILIRDVEFGYFQIFKEYRINSEVKFAFKTNINTNKLELRIYPGELYKCNDIGLKLSNVTLIEHGIDKFKLTMQSVERGKKIADSICSSNPEVSYVIINRHIGDAARNFSVLKAYKNYYTRDDMYHFSNAKTDRINPKAFPKNKIVDKIVVITTRVLSGVARMCEAVDDIVVLGKDDLNDLEQYASYVGKVHKNLYPDEDSAMNMLKFNLYQVGTFAYQFNLPKEIGADKTDTLRLSESTMAEANKCAKEMGINPRKTVIMCPMAQSNTMLDMNFWNDLVLFLSKKGFDIYTNVGGNEKALPNTKAIFQPVDVVCGLAKMGCKVIGVQSGLIDLMVWLKINNPIIVLSVINTERDLQFAKNRGLVDTYTYKDEVTYVLLKKENADLDMTQTVLKAVKEKFL